MKVFFDPILGKLRRNDLKEAIAYFNSMGIYALIEVANYSALPDPTTVHHHMYVALASQGTSWLPGSWGGNYYPEGYYYSDGTQWIYAKTPYQALQVTVDAGLVDNQFVSPLTFNNAAKWNTKVSSVTGPQVDDTDPNNPIVNTPTLQEVINESPTVDGVLTESLDGETYISINDNQIALSSTDGTDSTEVSTTPTSVNVSAQNGTDASLQTVTATSIDFSANSVTKNSSEIETQNNKDATGGYAGLTLFKINFKNVANTFTSFFTNSNTAARTYTFQNRNGTIADDTDLGLKTDKALRGYVSGGNFTTTSLTLVNITGLSVALDANSVYEINIKLTYESSSNAGLNTGVDFSAAGATIEAGEVGARDAEVAKAVRLSAFNTPSAAAAWVRVSVTPQTHEIKGVVRTGANAGNLTAQILKVSSGTATVYIDSYIRAQKV